MPSPLLRFGRIIAIVAMFCAIGGHWAVLRTVAWSGMIFDYSRNDGLVVAVEKTLSGRFPCDMCRTIASGQQKEKKADKLIVLKKLDVFHEAARPFVARTASIQVTPLTDLIAAARTVAPTSPPPRRG